MDIFKSIIVWLIGILYIVILFPVTCIFWLLFLPFDRKRVIIHMMLTCQSVILLKLLPIWKIKTEGRNNIVRGKTYIIISNHQSLIDILMINSLRYKFKWISKIENYKIPVLGWYMRMADYITVDRGNEASKTVMLEKSLKYLRRGISIMIFPEGTRSLNKEIGFFKRGAFQLAIEANVPVLPVLIDGTGNLLPKHGLIFRGKHDITIRVLEPVLPETFDTRNADDLALKFCIKMTSELNKLKVNTING